MALVSFGGDILYPVPPLTPSLVPKVESILIDASTEKAAIIFRASKAGTISGVMIICGSTTQTPVSAMTIRLETVSATDGYPTGTLIDSAGANDAKGTFTFTASTTVLATISTPPTVAIGDIIAIVVGYSSFNSGENANFGFQAYLTANNTGMPYSAAYIGIGPAWQKGGGTVYPPNFALVYGDGSIITPSGAGYAWNSVTEVTHSSSSSPDEYGNKFRLPFNARVVGSWGFFRKDGDYTVTLYDSDGTTALRTLSMDKDVVGTPVSQVALYFSTPVTLTKDTWYRITWYPNTTTSCRTWHFNVSDVGGYEGMDAAPCGSDMHLTKRTDAGAWTDTTTQRCMMGLVIDQLDDGAGGAGGLKTHPGMDGGMRG